MRSRWCLTSEDVRTIVAQCKRHTAADKTEATIAIVDQGGDLLYLERPDSHSPLAIDMAMGKARIAALRGRPSRALEDRIKERPGFLTMPHALAVRGGVPLFHKGECVGGVGISGLEGKDEETAIAAAKGFEA